MFIRLLLSLAIMGCSTQIFAQGFNQVDNMNTKNLSITFSEQQQQQRWTVTNDGVMGGLSLGNTRIEKNALIFSGNISTDNNGGFTSVFRDLPKLSDEIDSVKIKIKGDGQAYQLRVRSQVMGYQLAYKIEFDTKTSGAEILEFKLADFKASFRGRIIDNAPKLTANNIFQVGFLITTKKAQNFSLAITMIEFY